MVSGRAEKRSFRRPSVVQSNTDHSTAAALLDAPGKRSSLLERRTAPKNKACFLTGPVMALSHLRFWPAFPPLSIVFFRSVPPNFVFRVLCLHPLLPSLAPCLSPDCCFPLGFCCSAKSCHPLLVPVLPLTEFCVPSKRSFCFPTHSHFTNNPVPINSMPLISAGTDQRGGGATFQNGFPSSCFRTLSKSLQIQETYHYQGATTNIHPLLSSLVNYTHPVKFSGSAQNLHYFWGQQFSFSRL